MTTNDSNPPKTKRRWYQFRMRTLLVVVTVVTVPLGWVGWRLEQARGERAVIAWVMETGGSVSFHHGQRSWWGKSTDKWFGKRVRSASLQKMQVSDLSPLAELKNLEQLYVSRTKVSEEQVQKLRQALPNCEIHHVGDEK